MLRHSRLHRQAILRDDAYRMLGVAKSDSLAVVKLKYLLLCRQKHPEICGDARDFYTIAKAYATVLRDHGVTGRYGEFDYLPISPRELNQDPILPLDPAIAFLEAQAKEEADLLQAELDDRREAIAAGVTPPPESELLQRTRAMAAALREASSATTNSSTADASQSDREFLVNNSAAPPADSSSRPPNDDTPGNDSTVPSEATCAGDTVASHNALVEDKEGARSATTSLTTPQTNGQGIAFVDTPGIPRDLREYVCPITSMPIVPIKDGLGDEEVELLKTYRAQWRQLTPESQRIMDVIENRLDVVGEAARTSTDMMNEVKENKQLWVEIFVLITALTTLFFFGIVTLFQWRRYNESRDTTPAAMKEFINADTLLPWWGNDLEYERQVKRLFLEEWQNARSKAQRVQTFQDGIRKEEMDDARRHALDVEIFSVTANKLKQMRTNALQERSRVIAERESAPKVMPPIITRDSLQGGGGGRSGA